MWGCFSYYYYSLYHSYSISNKALSSDQRLLHDGSRKPLLPILKLISLFILLTFKICPQVNQYNYIYHACLVCACAYVPPLQCFLLYYSTFVFFYVNSCDHLFTFSGMPTWNPWWDTVCTRNIWPGAWSTLQQSRGEGQAAKPLTEAPSSSTPGSETPQLQVSLGPG